jgi:hypothetical protein
MLPDNNGNYDTGIITKSIGNTNTVRNKDMTCSMNSVIIMILMIIISGLLVMISMYIFNTMPIEAMIQNTTTNYYASTSHVTTSHVVTTCNWYLNGVYQGTC